jgi:hypothetical protein
VWAIGDAPSGGSRGGVEWSDVVPLFQDQSCWDIGLVGGGFPAVVLQALDLARAALIAFVVVEPIDLAVYRAGRVVPGRLESV